MQSLLLPPASYSGVSAVALRPGFQHSCHNQHLSTRLLPLFNPLLLAPKRKATISSHQSPPSLSVYGFQIGGSKPNFAQSTVAFSSPTSPGSVSGDNEVDKAKLAQVAKRLEKTSRYFKRLGSIGFWGQLVSTVVAAVILSFSSVVTGKPTSPATFYATASGIAASFVSVFWSFGYIRLSERLRRTAIDPSKLSGPALPVAASQTHGGIIRRRRRISSCSLLRWSSFHFPKILILIHGRKNRLERESKKQFAF